MWPVGAGRGRDHPGGASGRGNGSSVGQIGGQQRLVRRRCAQLRPHTTEPVRGAASQPDANSLRRVIGKVAGNQPPDEAGPL